MGDSYTYAILFALIGFLLGFGLYHLRSSTTRSRLRETELSEKEARTSLGLIEGELNDLKTEIVVVKTELEQNRLKLKERDVELKTAAERLEEQRSRGAEDREQLVKEFRLLSNKLLEENSQKLVEKNSKNIEDLIRPFKDRMLEFQQKVEQTHIENTKDRSGLKEKINELHKVYKELSNDAQKLADALRSDVKQQGNWGEMVLQKVLESSNLREGEEYYKQFATKDEHGSTTIPDFVVMLPEGKHLIIDSKVSLKHYESFVNAGPEVSEEERDHLLKQHILSVKAHIKGLSEKDYPSAQGMDSPDFVLLFMPIEASFALAVQEDKEIFDYAWRRKVVIVSPSTLLATLRTVSSLWLQERQNRNAQEIARQAGALYDKFRGLLGALMDVGKHLEKGQEAYATTLGRLSEGKGNLIGRVERLRDLGAHVNSAKVIDREAMDRELERMGMQEMPSTDEKG